MHAPRPHALFAALCFAALAALWVAGAPTSARAQAPAPAAPASAEPVAAPSPASDPAPAATAPAPAPSAVAAEQPRQPEPPLRFHLRVGAPERPPFATQASDGSWQGIAVDLWRMIADDHDFTYEIVRVPQGQLVPALAAGRLDIALALNATAGSEEVIDLTAPLYTSTLAVASRREVVLWHVARNLLSMEFLQVMVSLSLLLLAVGAVVWLLERKQNSKEFHRRPLLGLGDGFWWAGVTLTTIGYGDKAPKTMWGRAVAMVWMLIGLAVSAALTAALVSATNIEGSTGLRVPTDLVDRRVGAVEGSAAASYLYAQALAVEEFASLTQAFDALADERIDAVADGYAAIRVASTGLGDRVVISTSPRDPQYITIGMRHAQTPLEAERVELLRAAVLRHIAGDGWWRLVERYLPPEPAGGSSLLPGFE